MCEPNHSIVQYPDEDDKGPTGSRIESLPEMKEGWFRDKFKKIKSWFHLSKMGFGHSEAIGSMSVLARTHYLPQDTKYEAAWWCRAVKLDGPYYGFEFDRAEALQAATTYAHRVSIGSLPIFRQFLESSLTKSERPIQYVQRFLDDMLSVKGRDALWEKVKLISGQKLISLNARLHFAMTDKRASMIKAVMGITRVREFLNPEWGDDDKLWCPA